MAVAEAVVNGCQVVSYDLSVLQNEFGDTLVRFPCYYTEVYTKK